MSISFAPTVHRQLQPRFSSNDFEMVRLEAASGADRNARRDLAEDTTCFQSTKGFAKRHIGKLICASLVAIPTVIMGSLLAHCNTSPRNTIASARQYGIDGACPVHLTRDGDVYSGLTRLWTGTISPEGKAKDYLGLAKGEADEEGKLYKNFLGIDKALWPLPSAKVDEDGTVDSWPIPVPVGKVSAHDEKLPQKQRDALGLWILPKT